MATSGQVGNEVTGKHMTGAEAAVAALKKNGIDTVFGIPGGHSFPMYAALEAEPGIRHVLGRHEQGLGYMADGYARASGKIAAVSITSGPAVANIACAMGQATTDISPILVIASTPHSDLVGKNRGGLHDLNNSLDLARTVCRYVDHCATGDEIPGKINAILHRLRFERPGAALIQIPTDVMGSGTDAVVEDPPEAQRLEPDGEAIDKAAGLLSQAERPLIIVGTGAMVSGAGPVLRRMAEKLGAVVSTDVLSRGTIAGDLAYVIFPDGAAATPVNEVFRKADVILAVGTMFRQEDTSNWDISFNGRLVHIDIDPAKFGRSYKPDIAIHADALAACAKLADQVGARRSGRCCLGGLRALQAGGANRRPAPESGSGSGAGGGLSRCPAPGSDSLFRPLQSRLLGVSMPTVLRTAHLSIPARLRGAGGRAFPGDRSEDLLSGPAGRFPRRSSSYLISELATIKARFT